MSQLKLEQEDIGVQVVNIRDCVPPWGQPGDVRIDRGSGYGNPFYIGRDGTRDEVCEKYEKRFSKRFINIMPLIKAKRLGCWCKPDRCHGDFLKKIVDDFKKGLIEE